MWKSQRASHGYLAYSALPLASKRVYKYARGHECEKNRHMYGGTTQVLISLVNEALTEEDMVDENKFKRESERTLVRPPSLWHHHPLMLPCLVVLSLPLLAEAQDPVPWRGEVAQHCQLGGADQ